MNQVQNSNIIHDIMKEFGYGKVENTTPESCHQLNKNSIIIAKNIPESLRFYINILPNKIKKRLQINEAGLNGLATTVIDSQIVRAMNEKDFIKILHLSNQINQGLGLPPANSLVVRTARPYQNRNGANHNGVSVSEPMLLAINIEEDKRKLILKENGQSIKLNSISDFVKRVPDDTFLMIHDDNELLQTQAYHIKVRKSESGAELNIGTGILHARELDNPDSLIPSIQINTPNFEDLFKYENSYSFDINTVLKGLREPKHPVKSLNQTTFSFNNINFKTAAVILKTLNQDKFLIQEAVERANNIFGEGSVVEIRDYQIPEGGIGQKIHVLDVDNRF